MKRSQSESSGVPPAKKQVLTKMIPPMNIGSVSTEVNWQLLPFYEKYHEIEFPVAGGLDLL